MKNQLIPYNEVEQFGKAMVASGFFEGVNQISQAIVKIQAGAEIGLPPFASMTGVHIIKGKPVLGANLIATLIKNDPRYDYRVQRLDDEACMIYFYEQGQKVGESEFTTGDAKAAGINNQNWQKFPRNMLFARAISNGAKWYTPGIFGGMPVYTPDEFGIPVDEEGDVLEGSYTPAPTPVEVQPQPAAKQPEPKAATTGNGERVAPALQPTKAMFNKLHALGVQKFGGEWDDARHELIGKLTNGRTQSSKQLTYEEVVKLAELVKSFADFVEDVDDNTHYDKSDADGAWNSMH